MQYILIILLSIAIIFLSLLVKRLIRDVTLGLRATNKLIERYKSLRKDFDSMVEQNFEVKEYAKITNIPCFDFPINSFRFLQIIILLPRNLFLNNVCHKKVRYYLYLSVVDFRYYKKKNQKNK